MHRLLATLLTLDPKYIFAAVGFSLVIASYFIGYTHGKSDGFVREELLCKDHILQKDNLRRELQNLQLRLAGDQAKDATSKCTEVECTTVCARRVKKAIESFKATQQLIECGE